MFGIIGELFRHIRSFRQPVSCIAKNAPDEQLNSISQYLVVPEVYYPTYTPLGRDAALEVYSVYKDGPYGRSFVVRCLTLQSAEQWVKFLSQRPRRYTKEILECSSPSQPS